MLPTGSKRAEQVALFDLDGVFYEGNLAVPGGAETFAWFREHRIPHLFVTNTTSRPCSAIASRLADIGISVKVDAIVTPPILAARWIREHDAAPSALFVPPGAAREFGHLPTIGPLAEQGARSVVIGDLGDDWAFSTLNRAFRLLLCDPPPQLIALGMTRYWRAADGLRLDVGPFVRALEYACGRSAHVLGKPNAAFFDAALELLGAAPQRAVMIGDDIVGDVQAAQVAGLRGVLVRTGKFRPADLEGQILPDGIIDSIAALPGWWRKHQRRPLQFDEDI